MVKRDLNPYWPLSRYLGIYLDRENWCGGYPKGSWRYWMVNIRWNVMPSFSQMVVLKRMLMSMLSIHVWKNTIQLYLRFVIMYNDGFHVSLSSGFCSGTSFCCFPHHRFTPTYEWCGNSGIYLTMFVTHFSVSCQDVSSNLISFLPVSKLNFEYASGKW